MSTAAQPEERSARGRRMELAWTIVMLLWIVACSICAIAGLEVHELLDVGASMFDPLWIFGITCSMRITPGTVTQLGKDIRASIHSAHYLALAAGGVAQTIAAETVMLRVTGAIVVVACVGEVVVAKTPIGDHPKPIQPPPPEPDPDDDDHAHGHPLWIVVAIAIAFLIGRCSRRNLRT